MWRGFRIVLCKLFGLHKWVQAESLCVDGCRQFTACLYCRKELKTDEERHKEKLRRKFRLEATARKEQEMREELAEFMLKFNEKYNVLLEVKVKPMKTTKKNNKRKDDEDEN